jgi:hypothetical protein
MRQAASHEILAVVATAEPAMSNSIEPWSMPGRLGVRHPVPLAPSSAAPLTASFDVDLLWNDLSQWKQQFSENGGIDYIAAGSAAGVSSALTVGYVFWMLRGGSLALGLLAQMPAWRFMDPLVVLDYLEEESESKKPGDEEDSLEGMLKRSAEETSP